MSTRTIVLHIGPHKTGSTAIQRFCDGQRTLLASHGVCYPSGFWHGQLGSCFAGDPLNYIFNIHTNRADPAVIAAEDARYLETLSREIQDTAQPTVVLSYEGFFCLGPISVALLHSYLQGISDRQIVVFYARDPVAFARSELSQRLRMGLPAGFDSEHDFPALAYEDCIPAFVDVFGRENVVARHFDRQQLTSGDVVDDFFAAIGHPQINRQLTGGAVENENQSISAEAALLAGEIARQCPLPAHGNVFLNRYDGILSRLRARKLASHPINVHACSRFPSGTPSICSASSVSRSSERAPSPTPNDNCSSRSFSNLWPRNFSVSRPRWNASERSASRSNANCADSTPAIRGG